MPDSSPASVYEPTQLGPITLRNRIIRAATFEGRTPKALVTPELIDFHRRPAAGGVGMTTVAYLAVAPEGRTQRGQIWMRPDAVPGLRDLTDAIHREGAAASAQIGHAGPVANPKSTRLPALSASAVFSPMSMGRTRAASDDDIERIVRAHAESAKLAADSGFDAVELHFGHNYLVSSFLSPRLNKRTDRYGGSFENRARMALECARAVRDAVGGRIAITAKLNMDDGVAGGFWVDEAIQVARWLESEASLDALALTMGSSLLNPMYLFKGEAPVRDFAATMPEPVRTGVKTMGRFFIKEYPYKPLFMLDEARQIRAAVDMPLILLGGVTDNHGMNRALAEGFDFVAMARALLREPNLVNRLRTEADAESLCIHCNKCMPTIFTGARCVLADA